mmetsp:Transcript_66951/g.169878  ORF Transcript_66951/g.169878 Transcript_66951/m.169878 type:complete len:237 (-) Transcript_66951:400-1110(-)
MSEPTNCGRPGRTGRTARSWQPRGWMPGNGHLPAADEWRLYVPLQNSNTCHSATSASAGVTKAPGATNGSSMLRSTTSLPSVQLKTPTTCHDPTVSAPAVGCNSMATVSGMPGASKFTYCATCGRGGNMAFRIAIRLESTSSTESEKIKEPADSVATVASACASCSEKSGRKMRQSGSLIQSAPCMNSLAIVLRTMFRAPGRFVSSRAKNHLVPQTSGPLGRQCSAVSADARMAST